MSRFYTFLSSTIKSDDAIHEKGVLCFFFFFHSHSSCFLFENSLLVINAVVRLQIFQVGERKKSSLFGNWARFHYIISKRKISFTVQLPLFSTWASVYQPFPRNVSKIFFKWFSHERHSPSLRRERKVITSAVSLKASKSILIIIVYHWHKSWRDPNCCC